MIKLEHATGDVERRAGSGQKRVTIKLNNRYLKHGSLGTLLKVLEFVFFSRNPHPVIEQNR